MMIHHQVPGLNSEITRFGMFFEQFWSCFGCFPGETPELGANSLDQRWHWASATGWFVALPMGPNGRAREKARFKKLTNVTNVKHFSTGYWYYVLNPQMVYHHFPY